MARPPPFAPDHSGLIAGRSALLAVAVLAALLVPAVAVVDARPPPQELCGVCGDELSTEAPRQGVPLNVDHGALDLRFDANGTGHWHARARITPSAADRLAANATLREHVVRETYEHGRTLVDDPRNLTTRVENDTLVVDFDVPGAARTGPRGVVYASALVRDGNEGGVRVVADSLSVRGPNGTVVTSAVSGMETADGAAVWTRDDAGGEPDFARGAGLAFAPPGLLAGPATHVAILLSALARGGPLLAPVVAVPTLFLGAVTAALLEFDERVPRADPDRARRALVGVGGAVCLLGVLGSLFSPGRATVAVALLGAFYALLVGGVTVSERRSPVALAAWVAVTAAGASLGLVARGGAGGAFALMLLGIGLFLPMGAARGSGDRSLTALVGAVLLVPAVFAVGMGVATTVLSAIVASALLLAWVGLVATLGGPLYLLGRSLSGHPSG